MKKDYYATPSAADIEEPPFLSYCRAVFESHTILLDPDGSQTSTDDIVVRWGVPCPCYAVYVVQEANQN
jgi:hypothetical protein